MTDFEPKILGFLCNWCSYAGADLAGVSRNQYPPNVRVIRVMCSGRVDPAFIIEGLKGGLDGVIVLGCHLNDCHYIDGNFEEERKFAMVKKLLKLIELDDRVFLDWVSAAEGVRFAKIISEFIGHIKKLGPSPLSLESNKSNLMFKLNAVENVVKNPRIRALIGRERQITTENMGNVYGEIFDQKKFDIILEEALIEEFSCHQMLLSMEKGPKSVKGMAHDLGIESHKVLQYISKLKGNGFIELEKIEKVTPYYKVI